MQINTDTIIKMTKKVLKRWGYELWIVNNEKENYCGKILCIKPACSTSMHFHSNKHETFYVLEGELEVETVDTNSTEKSSIFLKEGDSFVIDRLVPHSLKANGVEVKFIEISTFHEDSDSYRVWE